MTFKDEVEKLIGAEVAGWTYHGDTDQDYDANVWFEHQPSADRPDGQPLSWTQLRKLNEEYGVVQVESNTYGKTGSRLCVRLREL